MKKAIICVFVIFMGYQSATADAGNEKFAHIPMTPELKEALSLRIRKAGFNCPAVKMVHYWDENVYGTILFVTCGPEKCPCRLDQMFAFRVIYNGYMTRVAPWSWE